MNFKVPKELQGIVAKTEELIDLGILHAKKDLQRTEDSYRSKKDQLFPEYQYDSVSEIAEKLLRAEETLADYGTKSPAADPKVSKAFEKYVEGFRTRFVKLADL